MKIIAPSHTAQNVTFLPEEILEVIFEYCRHNRSHQALQRDLHHFCLVSRSWYAAGAKYLYAYPSLTPRNFQDFATTICPSSTNRSRRVGLEHLVEHIDMGALAYESKSSTTSRLLSRTKTSLKSFVAPTVSFSTTCLAPLSKCVNLQHLDLSHDKYDFGFTALARTLSQLQSLRWLSLPKRCLAMYAESIENLPPSIWPGQLETLQVNENVPDMAFQSEPALLLQTFPKSLQTLRFQDVIQYRDMTSWMDSIVQLPQITEVVIGVRACEDEWALCRLLKTYPNLQKATVSGVTTWLMRDFEHTFNNGTWSVTALSADKSTRPPQHLEVLILEASPDYPSSHHLGLIMLEQMFLTCPRLLRIEVPFEYLDEGDSHMVDVDELNHMITVRAQEMEHIKTGLRIEDCGIFAGESKSHGVGLKRSFRPSSEV